MMLVVINGAPTTITAYFQNQDLCTAAKEKIVADLRGLPTQMQASVLMHNCFLARVEK